MRGSNGTGTPTGTSTRARRLRRRVDGNHGAWNPGPLQRLRCRRRDLLHAQLQRVAYLLRHVDVYRPGGADPPPGASRSTTLRPAGIRLRSAERRLSDRFGNSWTFLAGPKVGIGSVHSESIRGLWSRLHRQVGCQPASLRVSPPTNPGRFTRARRSGEEHPSTCSAELRNRAVRLVQEHATNTPPKGPPCVR